MRESVYSLETSFLVHSTYRVTDQFIHAYHMHARLGNEEQGCILSFGCPFRLLAAPANCQFCSSPHDMWMSVAALTLIVLLFTTGHSAVHEQVAAPPSGGVSFKGGFSLPIIHRNDPRSPLRDPTVTTLDLFKEEIQLASSPMPADDALASEKMLAPVHFRCGLYLVPLRIGGSLRGTSCLTLVLIYPGRSALLVMPVHVAITHLPSLAHFVVSSVMIHSVSILPVSVVLTHPAESAFFLGDTVMGYIEHIT